MSASMKLESCESNLAVSTCIDKLLWKQIIARLRTSLVILFLLIYFYKAEGAYKLFIFPNVIN